MAFGSKTVWNKLDAFKSMIRLPPYYKTFVSEILFWLNSRLRATLSAFKSIWCKHLKERIDLWHNFLFQRTTEHAFNGRIQILVKIASLLIYLATVQEIKFLISSHAGKKKAYFSCRFRLRPCHFILKTNLKFLKTCLHVEYWLTMRVRNINQ